MIQSNGATSEYLLKDYHIISILLKFFFLKIKDLFFVVVRIKWRISEVRHISKGRSNWDIHKLSIQLKKYELKIGLKVQFVRGFDARLCHRCTIGQALKLSTLESAEVLFRVDFISIFKIFIIRYISMLQIEMWGDAVAYNSIFKIYTICG